MPLLRRGGEVSEDALVVDHEEDEADIDDNQGCHCGHSLGYGQCEEGLDHFSLDFRGG